MSSTFENPLVVGCGSWGTALALLLTGKCPQVHLLGRNQNTIDEINSSRENKHYLPGITLPSNLVPTTDPGIANNADLVLFVIPTSETRTAAENLTKQSISKTAVLLSCSKGIERETGKRMSEIISDSFSENPVAVFSGPNHAEEIARGLPAAATIGCSNIAIGEALQHTFSNERFRCYTNEDVAGIELGGALKNIFAIAAGVAAGLKLGDNAISALVTRALAEMIRLGTQLGGNPDTFPGLSGLGDLMTTCFSPHSRNQRIGMALGKGQKLQDAVEKLGMVAEGVPNTRSIYEAARRVDARTPIIDVVYAMLYEDVPPAEALDRLFRQSPRNEVG